MTNEEQLAKFVQKTMLHGQDSVFAEIEALTTGTKEKMIRYAPIIEHCSRARQHLRRKIELLDMELTSLPQPHGDK